MKRILALLLAVLFVVSLSACVSGGKQQEQETQSESFSAEATESPAAGGWTLYEGEAATLPEDVQTAFDKATAEYTGMGFTPVAYLGSQVVAGVNYAVLCEGTTATAEPETSLKVVIIYADLDGNAEITNVADFNVADYTDDGGKTQTEALSGGWSVPEEVSSALIPDDAKEAFSKAIETFEGNNLEVMALLGTQVVSGVNYVYLCRSTIVTQEPAVSTLQVVTVYEDIDKQATISNICTLDVADFNR